MTLRTSIAAGALTMLTAGCAGLGSYPFDLPYIERDACPLECCSYGTWTATETLYVSENSDLDAAVLRELEVGATFTALGGDVHLLEPGTAVVREGGSRFAAGEHLWVFSYQGEGTWNVWYEGELIPVPMLPDDKARGEPGRPAVILEKPPRIRWWVEIEDHEGDHGWLLLDPDDPGVSGAEDCGEVPPEPGPSPPVGE